MKFEEALVEFKKLSVLEDDEINTILTKVDVDGNSTIEYSEFVAHALTNKQLSHRNLQLFFDQMKPVTKEIDEQEHHCHGHGHSHEKEETKKPLDEKDEAVVVPPKKYLNVNLIHAYM